VPGHSWVVVDTDVWSLLFGAKHREHAAAARWREQLVGRSVVVAMQTRAEVLTWLALGKLGQDRTERISSQLERTRTVPVTEDVVRVYADLTATCMNEGLGLHDKRHTGDRWVAATAMAIDAPLLAADHIYRGTPGLRLLT